VEIRGGFLAQGTRCLPLAPPIIRGVHCVILSGQLRIVMSAVVTTADGPMPSTVRMVFHVPGKGKR
jgi:hypothetical protein